MPGVLLPPAVSNQNSFGLAKSIGLAKPWREPPLHMVCLRFPEIVAALHQDIEGAELHLPVMLAGMQGIEIGDAVNAQDDRLRIITFATGLSAFCPSPKPGEQAALPAPCEVGPFRLVGCYCGATPTHPSPDTSMGGCGSLTLIRSLDRPAQRRSTKRTNAHPVVGRLNELVICVPILLVPSATPLI